MDIKNTSIAGLTLVRFPKFIDNRGFFTRNFCSEFFTNLGGFPQVSQANLSFNKVIGTVRGFHFQNNGHEEAKTVTVLAGAVHYKVIDLRKTSDTYGSVESFDLTELDWVVQVPRGCSPAFQTLEKNTLLHYYVSHSYSKENEFGIRYNDPNFDLKWPLTVTEVSERDSKFPDFDLKNFKGLESV